MKIAISTDGEYVSGHFGRCPSFTVVEIEENEIKNKEIIVPRKEIVNGVTIHRVLVSPKRGSKLRYVYEYTAMLVLGAIKLNILSLFRKFQIVQET